MTGLQMHLPALQVVVPLLSAPLVMLLREHRLSWMAATASSLCAFAIAVSLTLAVFEVGEVHYLMGSWPAPFGIELGIDAMSALVLLISGVWQRPAVGTIASVNNGTVIVECGGELPEKYEALYVDVLNHDDKLRIQLASGVGVEFDVLTFPCVTHALNCVSESDPTAITPADIGPNVAPEVIDALVAFLTG